MPDGSGQSRVDGECVIMRNAWVVCGPEGSGSVLIAKTISHATGHCGFYGQYSGYGYNSDTPCENLVLHRSLPYMRPKRFQDSLEAEVAGFSSNYDRVNYILTLRDRHCSVRSKMRRFGGGAEDAESDYRVAMPFFEKLASDDSCFIWSYEAMVLLGKSYFLRMYRFFGIESDFFPEIIDGNAEYLK